jgi:hypothetical protein
MADDDGRPILRDFFSGDSLGRWLFCLKAGGAMRHAKAAPLERATLNLVHLLDGSG